MNSATYQLTSMPTATNAGDLKYHSHYIARRLPAEVILDAIGQVTGVRENFPGYPGRRALQLPDAAVDSYFLTAFGRPPRVTAADSERQQEPSITQALHVINGDTINRKLARAARPDTGSLSPTRSMTGPRSSESTWRRSAGSRRTRRSALVTAMQESMARATAQAAGPGEEWRDVEEDEADQPRLVRRRRGVRFSKISHGPS